MTSQVGHERTLTRQFSGLSGAETRQIRLKASEFIFGRFVLASVPQHHRVLTTDPHDLVHHLVRDYRGQKVFFHDLPRSDEVRAANELVHEVLIDVYERVNCVCQSIEFRGVDARQP